MQAVVLAGGRGLRLHPLTISTPKPMLPLFSKTVMEHCIELLVRHGVDEVIVALSAQAKEIMERLGDGSAWGISIRYSVEDEPQGTAGAVKAVQPYINDTFLVVPADSVTDFDLSMAVEFHRRKSALATLLLHEVDDPSDFGIVHREPDGRITRFLEKPKSSEVFSTTVSTGIYVLEPDVLSSIPYFTACDFGRDLFPRLLRNLDPVYGCRLPGYWCDVGNLVHYRNAHFDALTGKADIDISGTQAEPGVWIGDDAEIHESAELAGPLFLGSGAELRRNAALRPFAVVGEQSLIDEAASVARSIVGSRAFISKGTRVSDCVVASGYRVYDQRSIRTNVVADDDSHVLVVGDPMLAPRLDEASTAA